MYELQKQLDGVQKQLDGVLELTKKNDMAQDDCKCFDALANGV